MKFTTLKRFFTILLLALLAFNANGQRRPKPSKQIEKAPDENHILLSDGDGEYQHTDYLLAPWANGGGSVSELVFAYESDVNPDSTCSPSLAEIASWNAAESTPHGDAVVYYNCTDDSTGAATYVYYIDTAGTVVLLESPDNNTFNGTRRIIPSPAFANPQAPTEAEAWAYIQLISPPPRPGTLFVQVEGAIPMNQVTDNPATVWFYDGQHITRIKDFPRKVEIPDTAFADTLNQTVTEVYAWISADTTFKGNYWLIYNIGAGTRDNPDWVYSINGDFTPSFNDIVCIKKPAASANMVQSTTDLTTYFPASAPQNGGWGLHRLRAQWLQRLGAAWIKRSIANGEYVAYEDKVAVTYSGGGVTFNLLTGNRFFVELFGDMPVNSPANLVGRDPGSRYLFEFKNGTEDSVSASFNDFVFKDFNHEEIAPQWIAGGSTKIFSFMVVPAGELTFLVSNNDLRGGTGGGGGDGITSLNSQIGNSQTIQIGTSGTSPNIASSANVHTVNIPDAGGSARGVINTTAQTIGGIKTFNDSPVMNSLTPLLPVKTLADRSLTAAAINLNSPEVTGTLPAGNLPDIFWKLTTDQVSDGTKRTTGGLLVGSNTPFAGMNFGTTSKTIFGLKGGVGSFTSESLWQDYRGFIHETGVLVAGTMRHKFTATGSDTDNEGSVMDFFVRAAGSNRDVTKGLSIEAYSTSSVDERSYITVADAVFVPTLEGAITVPDKGITLNGISGTPFRLAVEGATGLAVRSNPFGLHDWVQSNAPGWAQSSDSTLKENIEPVDLTPAQILGFKPMLKKFNWKASGFADIGVIAQDFQEDTILAKVLREANPGTDSSLIGVNAVGLAALALGAAGDLQEQLDEKVAGKSDTIASANDVALPKDENTLIITGTTQVNTINASQRNVGAEILLLFTSNVTVKHSSATDTGSNKDILLQGGTDFSATANDVLRLVFDGSYWRESGRTVIP